MDEEYKNNQDNNQGSYWDKPFDDTPPGESSLEDFRAAEDKISSLKAAEDKKKPKKVNIKRYKDVGGLTLSKLNIGLWYIEHKKQLRALLIGFLVLISAAAWTYTIYGFAYYFARGIDEDKLLARQITETGIISHEAILRASAKDLLLGRANALKSSGGRYDFFAQIKNPNKRHGAEFEYFFSVDGAETERAFGFVLPGESKYLLSLSNELASAPINIQLRFVNFSWKRIDRHEISDWNSYRDSRLDIIVSDTKFVSAKKSGLSDKIKLNRLEFAATNNTVYNYWNIDFAILLHGGPNIVGVNKYSLDEFMSGQTRQVAISWPGLIGRVSQMEIVPEINIMRDDIYIKYEGGAGEEK